MIAPAIAPREPDAVQRQPEHIRRAAVLVPANDRVARHAGNMAPAGFPVIRTDQANAR